jgi:hypothetical protein
MRSETRVETVWRKTVKGKKSGKRIEAKKLKIELEWGEGYVRSGMKAK